MKDEIDCLHTHSWKQVGSKQTVVSGSRALWENSDKGL